MRKLCILPRVVVKVDDGIVESEKIAFGCLISRQLGKQRRTQVLSAAMALSCIKHLSKRPRVSQGPANAVDAGSVGERGSPT
jgi:hypothetical protein